MASTSKPPALKVPLKKSKNAKAALPANYCFRSITNPGQVIRPAAAPPSSSNGGTTTTSSVDENTNALPSWHEVVGLVREWAQHMSDKPLVVGNVHEEAVNFLQYVHGKLVHIVIQ